MEHEADMETMRPYIQQLHDTPHKTVLAVSGAGTQAVAWLLGVSGASRTILEVVVPYGRLAMMDFLGFEPAQSASADTARQMARRAYQRARAQLEDDSLAGGAGLRRRHRHRPLPPRRPPGVRGGLGRYRGDCHLVANFPQGPARPGGRGRRGQPTHRAGALGVFGTGA